MTLDEEYYRKLNESEQRFYGIINEIRIQMGMPTVEVPFYEPKKSTAEASGKPEAIFEVPFVAIVESNKDEIQPRSENELHQQLESVSRIVVGEFDDPESTSCPSELSEMSRSQGNQLGLFCEKDPSTSRELLSSSFLLQTPNSLCHDARGDSVTKADGDRQILYVSSMEDSCPSKTEDDLSEIDATIDTSIHEIVPGRFVQVEKQSLLNAHHMFDEMPKGKVEVFQHSKVIFVLVSKMVCVDSEMVYDDNGDVFAHSIDLIRSRADDGEPNSIDSPGLFVFDPGKRNRFLLHSGIIEALVIFLFDPGISCKV